MNPWEANSCQSLGAWEGDQGDSHCRGSFLGVLHRPWRHFPVLEPLAAPASAALISDRLNFLSPRITEGLWPESSWKSKQAW